jgi:hypothetical protein
MLNYNVSILVNFDVIEYMILNWGRNGVVTVHTYRKIKRKRKGVSILKQGKKLFLEHLSHMPYANKL